LKIEPFDKDTIRIRKRTLNQSHNYSRDISKTNGFVDESAISANHPEGEVKELPNLIVIRPKTPASLNHHHRQVLFSRNCGVAAAATTTVGAH
jgi:hypothetical protein